MQYFYLIKYDIKTLQGRRIDERNEWSPSFNQESLGPKHYTSIAREHTKKGTHPYSFLIHSLELNNTCGNLNHQMKEITVFHNKYFISSRWRFNDTSSVFNIHEPSSHWWWLLNAETSIWRNKMFIVKNCVFFHLLIIMHPYPIYWYIVCSKFMCVHHTV